MAVGLGQGKTGTATAKRTGGVVLPEGVKLTEGQFDRFYAFRQGDSKVTFDVIGGEGAASVTFTVNGDVLRSSRASKAEMGDRIAIASRVKSIMKAEAASRPDGFRYSTSAALGDGLGDRRSLLYARAGFSRPKKSGGSQFAVVQGGRLRPDNSRSNEASSLSSLLL